MECGARRCSAFAFCHEATNTCKQCSDICHPERHAHYEPSLCLEQCRDYMFEQLKSQTTDGTARVLGALSLGVSAAALLGLLVLVFCLYRRPGPLLRVLQERAANKVNDKESSSIKTKCDIGRGLDSSVCTVSGSISEPELRLHAHAVPQPQQPPPAAPAPPAPPARHPSEDSTLDYAAYDNPALSPSSSPLPGSAPAPAPAPHLHTALDAVLPGALPVANGIARHAESSF